MIAQLAACPRAVVAGGAGAGFRVHVSEARAHPRGGAVAGIAGLIIGDRVIRRLALDDAVVMALFALMGDYADVSESRHLPRGGGGMALVARLPCRYVLRRLDGGGPDTAARRMAGLAIFRRAFEGPLDVTGFTGKYRVCSGQWKTRPDMVEMHVASRLSRPRVAI